MGILTKVILEFVDVGVMILEFFIIIRLLLMWRQINWLVPFDTAGKDLVNYFVAVVNKCWSRWRNNELPLKGQLIVGLIILVVLRNVLPVIAVLL